jgi:hypothetical protein
MQMYEIHWQHLHFSRIIHSYGTCAAGGNVNLAPTTTSSPFVFDNVRNKSVYQPGACLIGNPFVRGVSGSITVMV